MKIVFNNSQKLNEIVFANRNKNYGAYALRAAYNHTIYKSLTIVSFIIFLFSAGTYLYNKLNNEVEIVHQETNGDLKIVQYNLPDDKPDTPKPETKKAFIAPKADAAATVVSDTVQEKPTPTNDQIVNGGNPIGDPDAIAGTAVSGPVGDPEPVSTPTVSAEPTAFPEQDPEFEGGLKALREFIANNVVYPSIAREIGQEGTVHVTFVIDENGVVENSKVLKGIGYGCDEESIRVINKIPKFKKPGRNRFGIPVKTIFNIPIAFHLRN